MAQAKALLVEIANPMIQRRLIGLRGNIPSTLTPTATKLLQGLVNEGVITEAQFDAWKDLRNPVAHGEPLNYWKDSSPARGFGEVVELLQVLTAYLIGFVEVNQQPGSIPGDQAS